MVSVPPLFLCTHDDVGLAIVFRCFGERSKVFQVYPSIYESRLKGIPGLTVCCSENCCSAENVSNSSTSVVRNDSYESRSDWSNHSAFYRYIWGSSEFYSSPHFWTAIVVLVLVCFMILQNAYSYKRSSRVLPMLERETAGPYASTRESGGIILPKLVYKEGGGANKKAKDAPKEKENEPPKHKRVITEMLNAADLMAMEMELSKDCSEKKILADDEPARVYVTEKRNKRTKKKLRIQLFEPSLTTANSSSNLASTSSSPSSPYSAPYQPSISIIDTSSTSSSSVSPSSSTTSTTVVSEVVERGTGQNTSDQSHDPAPLPNQILETRISIDEDDPAVVEPRSSSLAEATPPSEEQLAPNMQIIVPELHGPLDLLEPPPGASQQRNKRRYSLEVAAATSATVGAGIKVDPGYPGSELQPVDPTSSVNMPLPLVPAYHPHRRVSGVWRDDNSMERLYRYTHMDRLVYPPGYIT